MDERKTLWPIPWLCYLFHAWRKVEDTGINVYCRCRRCGSRAVFFPPPGHGYCYEAIDRHWIETGTWYVMGPPPNIRTGIPPKVVAETSPWSV